MPQTPDFVDALGSVTDAAVLAVLLGGLGGALRRTKLPAGARTRLWLIAAATLLIWYSGIRALAERAVFQAVPDAGSPALPFAVVLPVVFGLWLMVRSKTVAAVVDATPLAWLVGIQAYRVIGAVFLVLWGRGLLPGAFALPAGIGDIIVGVAAIAVAWMLGAGRPGARSAAIGWNLLGILDLVVALATGFLTSPSQFQLLSLDRPNLLATAYPLAMIPTFLVPLSLILHGVCLWKLQRETRTLTAGAALA